MDTVKIAYVKGVLIINRNFKPSKNSLDKNTKNKQKLSNISVL